MSKAALFGLFLSAVAGGCDGDNTAPPANDLTMTGNGDSAVAKDAASPADMTSASQDGGAADLATVSTTVNAVLSGGQENPPVASAASGTASFTVDQAKTTITVVVNVANLNNITAAHIHAGKPGSNGPVIFPLA